MAARSLAGVPDAVVTQVETLPEHLENSQRAGRFMQIRPGAMLLRVPEVGAFLAQNGRQIQIAPAHGADPAAVDMYLHGAARAALLYQRGDLPLHASTVLPPGGSQAIAICGFSGAGKSTLAVEMYRRGWTVLADDTTRVSLEGGHPIAWPSHRGVKLWQDACDDLRLETDALQRVRRQLQKFYYPVTQDGAPVRLGAVAELSRADRGLHRLRNLPERMTVLSRHAFRQRQIVPSGMMAEHLRFVGVMVSQLVIACVGDARELPVSQLGDRLEEVAGWLTP